MIFRNRTEAGRRLADALQTYRGQAVVYALPTGGVVVAAEVARILGCPLEFIVVETIGHPMSPNYAIGAVTEHTKPIWNEAELGFTDPVWCDRRVRLARQAAKRRRIKYQGDQTGADTTAPIAILVSDGASTGLAVAAACRHLRQQSTEWIVAALPVAAEEAARLIDYYADETVALHVPPNYFVTTATYYESFEPVSDEEVRQLLAAYRLEPVPEPLDIPGVNAVLATVTHYPVTSATLAAQAKRLHSPDSVISFFETMPTEIKFRDKADVMRRSQEVELIMEELATEPAEFLRSFDT